MRYKCSTHKITVVKQTYSKEYVEDLIKRAKELLDKLSKEKFDKAKSK